jgi:AraC-like DNA-binding protein
LLIAIYIALEMNLAVDILSIALLATLCQGLFFLSVIAVKHGFKEKQNLFLFFLVLSIMWYQAEFLSVRLPYDISFNLFYGTRYGSWLLLGPLYYCYVQAIISDWRNKHLVHFLPFVVFIIILPMLTTDERSSQQVNYGMLSTFGPFGGHPSAMEYFASTIFIVQFLHLLSYVIISYRDVRRYEVSLKGTYSSLETNNIIWLKLLSLMLLLVVVFVSAFLILFHATPWYNRDKDYLYVLPMAVLIYIVSYRLSGIQWPSAEPERNIKTEKYSKSSLKPEQADTYARQLEQHLINKRSYLKNELRLQDLAEELNIPSYHLSQIINEQMNTTFFDLVNRYRVEEAKKLIAEDKNSSLLEIAFKAGFNNKTSFTNAFKKVVLKTPAAYRKQVDLSSKGEQKA